MGKKKKPKGFNTPFADLKVELPQKQPKNRKKDNAPAASQSFPSPTSSPETLVAEMMSDVVRMDLVNKVPPKAGRPGRTPSATEIEDDESLALNEFLELVDSPQQSRLTVATDSAGHAVGRGHGVNNQRIKQLQRGDIPPRRTLDLHGLTKKEAFNALRNFIRQARLDSEYCVLVITGKGQNSTSGLGILKDAVPLWLSKSPNDGHILGFCVSQPKDGGTGALYVLLRKFP